MGRPCSICEHPSKTAIETKIRSSTPYIDIERWLATTDHPSSRMAISRHAGHAGLSAGPRTSGPRPASASFLQDVVDTAHEDLSAGSLKPSLRDGIAAQVAIDGRVNKTQDRDLMLGLIGALSGAWQPQNVIDVTPDPMALEAAEDAAFFAQLGSGEAYIPPDITRERAKVIAKREQH